MWRLLNLERKGRAVKNEPEGDVDSDEPEEDYESDEVRKMECEFCGKKVREEDFWSCCNCYLCKDCCKRGPCGKHDLIDDGIIERIYRTKGKI